MLEKIISGENIMLGLGSVVILKNKDNSLMSHKLVIAMRYLLAKKDSKEYYKYKGVIHPFVNYKTEGGVLFNDEFIGEVVFEGYLDEEDVKFCKAIEEQFSKLGIVKAKRS